MTEVLLHRLDIVTLLQSRDRVCVSQIMESSIGSAYLLGYPLKVNIEGYRSDVLTFLVGEYKVVVILPRKGVLYPLYGLFALYLA